MTSTKAERAAIDARAKELMTDNTPLILDVLADEFGISRERVRSSVTRVRQKEQPRENKTIKIQMLYDLHTITGFCSEMDLHRFFLALGLKPSPPGEMEIERRRVAGHQVGIVALSLLQLPLADSIDIIMGYRQ